MVKGSKINKTPSQKLASKYTQFSFNTLISKSCSNWNKLMLIKRVQSILELKELFSGTKMLLLHELFKINTTNNFAGSAVYTPFPSSSIQLNGENKNYISTDSYLVNSVPLSKKIFKCKTFKCSYLRYVCIVVLYIISYYI